MSTGNQADQNTYSGDWIDDPANVDALRHLLWDILTLPDSPLDDIELRCAGYQDDLGVPTDGFLDSADVVHLHPRKWWFQTIYAN
jgi:hypothetical protein